MAKVRKTYITKKLFDEICDHVAEGNSVRSFDFAKHKKTRRSFFNWLDEQATSADLHQYARASNSRADVIFEECLDIADNATDDVKIIDTQNGDREVINHSAIQRARLQIDTRRWMLGKMNAKKYGDKHIISGDSENPVSYKNVEPTVEEVKEYLKSKGLPTEIYDE